MNWRRLIEYTTTIALLGLAAVSILHGLIEAIEAASVLPLLVWTVPPIAIVGGIRMSYRRT